MLKKIIISVFAALFLFSTAKVNADSFPRVETDWVVEFKNKKLTENFNENEVKEALKGMQPGDDAVLEYKLVNSYDQTVGWWASNDILKSFEDSSVASGGAYSYLFEYIDPNGDARILYSSESVGGENETLVGLHGATDALDERFFLGDIGEGESAIVRLHISLEGETQNNSYQDVLARLMINFAVELPEEKRFIIPKTGVFSGLLDDLLTGKKVNLYLLNSIVSFLLMIVLSAYLYINRKARTVK